MFCFNTDVTRKLKTPQKKILIVSNCDISLETHANRDQTGSAQSTKYIGKISVENILILKFI